MILGRFVNLFGDFSPLCGVVRAPKPNKTPITWRCGSILQNEGKTAVLPVNPLWRPWVVFLGLTNFWLTQTNDRHYNQPTHSCKNRRVVIIFRVELDFWYAFFQIKRWGKVKVVLNEWISVYLTLEYKDYGGSVTDKRTDACSWPSCNYTQILAYKKRQKHEKNFCSPPKIFYLFFYATL